jgi:hypothetical protein
LRRHCAEADDTPTAASGDGPTPIGPAARQEHAPDDVVGSFGRFRVANQPDGDVGFHRLNAFPFGSSSPGAFVRLVFVQFVSAPFVSAQLVSWNCSACSFA